MPNNCHSCFFNARQSDDGCVCEVRSLTNFSKEEMNKPCDYHLPKNYKGELYRDILGYQRPQPKEP